MAVDVELERLLLALALIEVMVRRLGVVVEPTCSAPTGCDAAAAIVPRDRVVRRLGVLSQSVGLWLTRVTRG
jgi:hypothetical protein